MSRHQNKNRNHSINKVKKLGYKRLLMCKQPRQDLDLCGPLYVKKVRTNTGKQTIGYAACIIWDKIPLNLKQLNIYQFS